MRAVVITRHGGPDVLQVQERPDPGALAAGDVRIDVAAAGVNFADVMARIGVYPDAPPTPCVVGYEVAGTVVELGEAVSGLGHGDRVMAGTSSVATPARSPCPPATWSPCPSGSAFSRERRSRSTTPRPGPP